MNHRSIFYILILGMCFCFESRDFHSMQLMTDVAEIRRIILDTELEGFASAGRRIACLRPCCKKEKAGFR